MDDTNIESKQDISTIDTEINTEQDKCEEFLSRNDETCDFKYGKLICKCVEEFRRKQHEKKVNSIVLPSEVTDREEMYFPDNITKEDPILYGKWLIFTNGDLALQDHLWIQLQKLLKCGTLILLESSTAKLCDNRGPFQGVIKCYTVKDINVIRSAGIAVQSILNDNSILDYKTNEASQKNLYRAKGNRFITKFMLTVNGKLYKKDKLCRWIQFTDDEYKNFKFDEDFPVNNFYSVPPFKKRNIESGPYLLPSMETSKKKKRYVYPDEAHLNDLSGIWCLFCNVVDTDNCGLTELDHGWIEARVLCDKKYFKSITCETKSCKPRCKEILSRRSILCEVYHNDIDQIIDCADKLRERISYNMPMYFKTFLFNQAGKPEYRLKYLYTEDKELFEYTLDKWILFKTF